MTASGGVYLGLRISSGVAYFGAVESPDQLLLDDPLDKLASNTHLDTAAKLEDFRARVAQELRRLEPAAVGVARTMRYQQWSYQSAFDRFSLEAAAMLAATAEQIPCYVVKQERAGKAVGLPPNQIADRLAGRLGIEAPAHWEHRSVAFAAALALVEDVKT